MNFIKKVLKYLYRETILHLLWYFSSYFPMFPTLMFTKGRSFFWRLIGVQIGEKVQINYGNYLDVPSAKRLIIEDNVLVASECLFLLHKRDMSKYTGFNLQNSLPMKEGYIKICKNASIGMRTIILPNVTIGEGAVIGANSLVSKDIPPFSIAVGNPAKVIKYIKAL
tara:strand:+ start:2342 stop:2842 length:501 start_codon:yes stop_codon:yes gene_type:complete